jgi:DNA-directed RNA polymerase subunit N (RpoN/RPB10)
MYPYIVCYCGRSVGDLYPLFDEMRKERYEEYFKKTGHRIEPNRVTISSDVHVDLGDVFKKLNIRTQCCKARLLTQLEYKEYY